MQWKVTEGEKNSGNWNLGLVLCSSFFFRQLNSLGETLEARRVRADQTKLKMTMDLKRATSSLNECRFLLLLQRIACNNLADKKFWNMFLNDKKPSSECSKACFRETSACHKLFHLLILYYINRNFNITLYQQKFRHIKLKTYILCCHVLNINV